MVANGNPNHENEKAVLCELIKNAKQSNNDIAKKIGLTRQTVHNIIKKLEKDKTIWGYTAVANPDFFDKKMFVVLLKLKPVQCIPLTMVGFNCSIKVTFFSISSVLMR